MKEKFLQLLKLIAFFFLIPIFIAGTEAFLQHSHDLPQGTITYFWRGVVVLLIVHLFLIEVEPIYQLGRRITGGLFRFTGPAAETMGSFFPIYMIVAVILYFGLKFFLKTSDVDHYVLFLAGIAVTLHMVYVSRDIRGNDTSGLSADYFFKIPLVYVVNILILAALFEIVFKDFSFAEFIKDFFSRSGEIYTSIFRQLFVP